MRTLWRTIAFKTLFSHLYIPSTSEGHEVVMCFALQPLIVIGTGHR